MPTATQPDAKTNVVAAAIVNTWQHKLWVQVNNHWSDTTGDMKWLLPCDGITGHLYQWAIDTGRIKPVHPYPFHRTSTIIAPAFHADRSAFEAEAHRYIRDKMAERRAQLDRMAEEKRIAEEQRLAKLAEFERTP